MKMNIIYTILEAPPGPLFIAETRHGVLRVIFGSDGLADLVAFARRWVPDHRILPSVVDSAPQILEFLEGMIHSKIGLLLILNVFLILVGCMMDIFSAILIVVPLIMPLAGRYGIDPVHLGIIFLANLGIGYNTPPIGLNLFIAGSRFDKPLVQLYRATLPFLLLLLLTLLLITYWPALSLFLPGLLKT